MSKVKPNAFMEFVFDWKQKSGTPNMDINQAIAKAGAVWANMTTQQRAPYKARAKDAKVEARGVAEKLDCLGRPLNKVQIEKDEAEQRQRQIKRRIETTVKNSVKKFELENQHYFFVMVNYFTRTREGVYVPAEIAIAKFSLKEGVHRNYHTLINPGVDIFGHQYEAQSHAEATHMLPLPPRAMGQHDLGQIYNDLLEFVRDRDTGDLAPLYTHRDHIVQVESVFNFLQADVGAGNDKLEVFPIQYLFYIMKEATCEMGEQEKPRSVHITDAHFERDFFDYQIGIACKYHEDKDRTKYCALSYVTRWGFMFSEYMCSDIAISLIPGRHVPQSTNMNAITIEAPSESSFGKRQNQPRAETMPDKKWDQRWENESTITDTTFNTNDFPTLGAAPKKYPKAPSAASAKHFKQEELPSFSDDDFPDEDPNNPWTSRSKRQQPSEPDNSAFEIRFKRDSADDTTSVSSFGRGRGNAFMNNRGSGSKRGRGQCF